MATLKKMFEENDLIHKFINDEEYSTKKNIQGKFYIMNHHEIHALEKKSLNKIDAIKKRRFFFNLIKLCYNKPTKNKIKETNFSTLIEAYIDILKYANNTKKTIGWWLFKKPKLDTLSTERIPFTSFFKLDAYFLFGANEYSEENSVLIRKTTFETYTLCWQFIKKAHSYQEGGYSKMRAKSDEFMIYVKNSNLIERIYQSLKNTDFKTAVFPSNGTFWAFVMVLILADKEEYLKKVIECNNERNNVFVLGSFLKEFNEISTGKNLLKSLYQKHPKEWVDEWVDLQ